MEQLKFAIRGESGCSITLVLAEVFGFPSNTSFFGGYEVRANATVKIAAAFNAQADFATSTGEFYLFLQELDQCQSRLSGTANYESFERELSFSISYQMNGMVEIQGKFAPSSVPNGELFFSFESDQSYLQATISQLKKLTTVYGDMKGVK